MRMNVASFLAGNDHPPLWTVKPAIQRMGAVLYKTALAGVSIAPILVYQLDQL